MLNQIFSSSGRGACVALPEVMHLEDVSFCWTLCLCNVDPDQLEGRGLGVSAAGADGRSPGRSTGRVEARGRAFPGRGWYALAKVLVVLATSSYFRLNSSNNNCLLFG